MRAILSTALAIAVAAAPLGGWTQPAPGPDLAPVAAPAPSPVAPPPAAPAPTAKPKPAAATAAPPSPVLTAAPGVRLAPGQPIPQAELEAYVDGMVRDAMATNHIAGVTVSVVQNGQVVFKKGYGYASFAPARPVDPDLTLFRIGSISKTFTWILLQKEVEAGQMRLDAPINRYLPERLKIPDQGFTQPIRLRNFMNHEPGFEDRALGQLFERDYKRVRPLETYLRQERPRRVREPGTLPSYSNYGVALVGAALAETTGTPFERLAEVQILDPIGLSRTSFREPHPVVKGMPAPMRPAIARDVSDGFRWTPTGFQKRPFEYLGQVAPAGAVSSTAGDMARYMLLFLGGGTLDGVAVYGPATAQAFANAMPPPAPGVVRSHAGLIEYPLPGGFTGVGHSGGTLSFLSNMVIVPDLGLGVFVSTNTESGGSLSGVLAQRIVERFYAAPPAAPRKGSPELAHRRGDFEGVYLTTRRAYHGLEGFLFRLIGAQTVRVTSDGRLITGGFGGQPQRWTPEGDPGKGQFLSDVGQDRLVFQMKDGKAQRYFASWGGAALERTGFLGQAGALNLLAVLTAIAAIATLIGLAMRLRRDYREFVTQQRAGLLQTSQAALWLLSMVLMGVWAMSANDLALVMYDWPALPVVLASACALVAALMAAANVAFLPFIWRGGRRVDSWSGWRKARFTLTTVIFLAFALLLMMWGALEPWSA